MEKSIHCIPILDSISLISPNIDELVELVKELKQEGSGGQAGSGGHAGVCTVEEVQEMGEYVVQHMRGDTPSWVIVTMGERGVVLCSNEEEESQHLLPDVVDEEMVNCTGAGDCLLATVAALRLQGSRETLGMETCVRIGMRAASMTIQSDLAVSKVYRGCDVGINCVGNVCAPGAWCGGWVSKGAETLFVTGSGYNVYGAGDAGPCGLDVFGD